MFSNSMMLYAMFILREPYKNVDEAIEKGFVKYRVPAMLQDGVAEILRESMGV